ncbi:MAG: sensor histidine kinase [Hyphomicrobiaceae bacterium]|nr:sensor histidine kinase [Hyphomicrobiaceae bacterium]
MLACLNAMHRWSLAARLGVATMAVAIAYLFQIPLEREVPGEPFLLFFLIVSATALAFGRGVGLFAVGLSTFLSFFFFEPGSNPALLIHASDLIRVELYALLAAGSAVGLARLAQELIAADQAAHVLELSERANSVLLRELAHRVANNFAAVASLIRRKADQVGDPNARSVLNEAVEQVMVLARVHGRLRRESDEVCLDSKAFIQELCEDLQVLIARGQPLSIRCSAVSRRLSVAEAIPLGLIVNELVTNAVKYAFPDGRPGTVRVTLEEEAGDRLYLSVEDDGVGLGSGRSQGSGLGLDLVRALAQQLGGKLEVRPASQGGLFRLEFRGAPVAACAQQSPAALVH